MIDYLQIACAAYTIYRLSRGIGWLIGWYFLDARDREIFR